MCPGLGTGRIVIVEDRFGATNHDHLGKILTYATGLEAEAVVWIAEKIRDEHRQTLEWLIRHTDGDMRFFGVVVELLQIDTSVPTVNFKSLVFPNEWQREVRESAEGRSPRAEGYRNYFQSLIDDLREKAPLYERPSRFAPELVRFPFWNFQYRLRDELRTARSRSCRALYRCR